MLCSYLCLASSNCSLGLLYNDLLGLALLALYLHSLPTLNLNLTWLDQLNLWRKSQKGTLTRPLVAPSLASALPSHLGG